MKKASSTSPSKPVPSLKFSRPRQAGDSRALIRLISRRRGLVRKTQNQYKPAGMAAR
jgi:hypothetical protein